MYFSKADLGLLEDRYRARLINSLSGFKSANLIGTVSRDGVTNLSIVSSVFHLGANPPLVGMIIRPHSVTRDTLENILDTGQYTINQVGADFWQAAHQCSARYPAEVCEFTQVGLTPTFTDGILPPFVAESRLKYALDVKETTTLQVNGTVLVIGEVSALLVEESAIAEDGYVDIEALNTVAVSGLDSYHRTERLGRLTYAKPDMLPRLLEK